MEEHSRKPDTSLKAVRPDDRRPDGARDPDLMPRD